MMSRTENRIARLVLLALLSATVALGIAPAQGSQGRQDRQGAWKQIIVKCDPEDLDRIRELVAAAVVDAIPGHFLLTVPFSFDVGKLQGIRGRNVVVEAEDDEPVLIQRRGRRSASTTTTSATPLGALVNYYGAPARQAYIDQPAARKIELKKALNLATGAGVRIAIIDTGVDERHPTLKSVLLGGKNYVGRTQNPSEMDDPAVNQQEVLLLDQQEVLLLDQQEVLLLDQQEVLLLDQQEVLLLDQQEVLLLDQLARRLPAFGHGTMMAGLVHLAAPHARIIPLKAFDANGGASEWNVIRAIYDAVTMGADVINMSFSASEKNRLIQSAIRFAVSRGVAVVASAGNNDSEVPTYPASEETAIGVSAVDLDDQKASFSNFGKYIDISAPGVDMITTYLGGRWAVASGTSDAVPVIAGVLALVKSRGVAGAKVRERVEESADPLNVPPQYRHKLGKGRVNAIKAVGSSNDDSRD